MILNYDKNTHSGERIAAKPKKKIGFEVNFSGRMQEQRHERQKIRILT